MHKTAFEQASQELKALHYDLKNALTYLKKKYTQNTQSNKPQLFILLGSNQAGKTSLLFVSGLKLVNSKEQPLKAVVPTNYCSWWFAENLIFLDTASVYTHSDEEYTYYNLAWRGFLKLLKNHRDHYNLNSVIININLPELVNNKIALQKFVISMRERIYELAKYIAKLSIIIVCTKSDLIAGFNEFFSSLSIEERAQSFGITLTTNQEGTNDVILAFDTEFNALVEKLQSQVLQKIYLENEQQKIGPIKDFPLQIENLKNTLTNIINKIPFNSQISLAGVFFTSSIQQGQPYDSFADQISATFELKPKPSVAVTSQNYRGFFVEDLFQKFIVKLTANSSKLKPWPKTARYFLIAFALLVLIASSLFWSLALNKNLEFINAAKFIWDNNQTQNTTTKLHKIISSLDKANSAWLVRLGFNQINKLNHNVKQIYYIYTINTLTTQMQQILENKITSTSIVESRSLYDALKAYLMLCDQQYMDQKYLQRWFGNYWEQTTTINQQDAMQLKNDLKNVLARPIKISPKNNIITAARDKLNASLQNQIVYLLLENQYDGQNFLINATKSIPFIAYQQIGISKMYTKKYIDKIYQTQIPEIVNNLAKGDWVLGATTSNPTTSANIDKLIAETRTLYLENYILAWEKTLGLIKIEEFKNLTQATQLLTSLAEPNSSFLQILKLAQTNLTQTKIMEANFTQQIGAKYPNFNNLNINLLQSALSQLANNFITIAKSSDSSKAAFITSIIHLQSTPEHPDALTTLNLLAAEQPEPIKSWLKTIVYNSWQLLLDNTKQHIANEWLKTVVPACQKTLNNAYPVFKDAEKQITIKDFNNFFAPKNIIDSFFNTYLKPFVTTNQMYWEWKNFNNVDMKVSQTFLETFIRAALIQKMFYLDNNPKLNIQFTLIPLTTTPNTKHFILNLEGQFISYEPGDKKPQHLIWPGPKPGTVSFEFINKNGKRFATTQIGPWAWFKILDKASIRATANLNRYELTFDLNGNAIKYQLISEQALNPFIPGIINNFRCSEIFK